LSQRTSLPTIYSRSYCTLTGTTLRALAIYIRYDASLCTLFYHYNRMHTHNCCGTHRWRQYTHATVVRSPVQPSHHKGEGLHFHVHTGGSGYITTVLYILLLTYICTYFSATMWAVPAPHAVLELSQERGATSSLSYRPFRRCGISITIGLTDVTSQSTSSPPGLRAGLGLSPHGA
jgi:hypothetical protein